MTLALSMAEALDPVRFAAARGFGAEEWQARPLLKKYLENVARLTSSLL